MTKTELSIEIKCVTLKHPYDREMQAMKAMKYLNKKYETKLKYAYKCPECGKWHLTSKYKRK